MKNKLLTLLPIVSIVATPLALCSCWNPANHTIKEQLNKFTKNTPNTLEISDLSTYKYGEWIKAKITDKYRGNKENNDEKIETYLQGFKKSIIQLKNNQKFFYRWFCFKWDWNIFRIEKNKQINEFLKKYFDLDNLKSEHFSMGLTFASYTQEELKNMQYAKNVKNELKYDFSFIDINNLRKRETIRKEWFNGYFTWEKYIIKNNLVEFKILDLNDNHVYSCFKYMDLDSGWVEKK